MRILKYLFLLLLLSIVALSIFVATQKGKFTVERSKVINSPRHSVYTYVNDLKNWGDWNSLAVEDSLINIKFSPKTVGNGSVCTWDGNQGDGTLQTLNAINDLRITQKMNFNGNSADVIMNFKDTIGGTKVTWKAKGEMSFLYKVQNTFTGGAQRIFEILFEKSLSNLDRKLVYEINTFAIKENGITNQKETYYLAQSFRSEFSKVMKNSEIVIAKISGFCVKNNITISGKPFIIYHTYDEINKLTKLSICVPIKDAIFLSEGSDILSDTLKTFQAVHTTLTGDYSHRIKALDKSKAYINNNQIKIDPQFSHIEVLSFGKNDINNPSKWITDFYFPISQKNIVKPTVIIPKDTLKVTATVKPVSSLNGVTPAKLASPVKAISPVKIKPKVKAITPLKISPAVNVNTPPKHESEKAITPASKSKVPVKTETEEKNNKDLPAEF